MKQIRVTQLLCAALLATLPLYGFGVGEPQIEPGADVTNSQTKPNKLKDVSIDQKLNEQVPLDLKFKNEEGKEVKLGDYFGKRPVVLSLVYFQCPMLCTQVLNGLVTTMRPLQFSPGKEFDVVTVSFDPRDTPALAAEKKKNYIHSFKRAGAAAGWHFLTGDQESIKKLTDSVGFRYVYDEKLKQFAHAAVIMVLTPEGKVSKYFYGIEYSPRDLRLGLIEAANHKIGTPVDSLLLYCYHYDPATGKYGAATMNIIRLAGALTVLALVSFMFIMFRRDRVKKRLAAEGHA